VSSFTNVELAHDDGAPGLSKASIADNMRAYASTQKQPGTIYPASHFHSSKAQTQPSSSPAHPSPQQRKQPELRGDMHFSQSSMQRACLPPQVPAQVFPTQQQDVADAGMATVKGRQGAVEGREEKKLELSEDMHFSLPSMENLWWDEKLLPSPVQ